MCPRLSVLTELGVSHAAVVTPWLGQSSKRFHSPKLHWAGSNDPWGPLSIRLLALYSRGLSRQPQGSQPFPAVAADFGVSQDRTAEAVLSNQPSEVRQHPSHCVLANRRCEDPTSFQRRGGRLQILINGVSNNLQTF